MSDLPKEKEQASSEHSSPEEKWISLYDANFFVLWLVKSKGRIEPLVCIFLPCCSFPPYFYLPRLIFMFKDKATVRVSEVAGKI